MNNETNLEIVERQNVVIKMQQDIIRDLFSLLSQYIAAEELDRLPAVEKINHAAAIMR